ncbi:MAG TPA: FecR family protein [Polyangiaceae bacterium]|nr:FecR family protein [Polyangiaceae bacterium]
MKLLHESMQEPIREVLDDSVSEEVVQRVWKGVRRRRSAGASSGWRFERRYWAVFASAAMAMAFVFWFLRAPSKYQGPLLEANGQVLNSLGADSASSTLLNDGSRILLGPGAALEVLDNDESAFVCVLRRGRGTFEVKPGGPRRWRVEAGPLRVEVIGTRFTVDRSKSRVSVDVDHGTVLVRGDRVPDGVQKLTAGSRLVIDTAERASAERTSSAAPSAGPGPAGAGSMVAASSGEVSTAKSSSAAASAQAPSAKIDLLQLADEQRRHGNVKGAIATLRTASSEGGDSARRAIAAFTLGRLLLDSAGRPAEAAQAFRSCLRLAPPAAIAEDAAARLVEALARSGNRDAAQRSAREYERRYPSGRRLADVRRWAAPG